jgi:hypothetical protein
MSFFTKTFGPNKFQLDIQKAYSLKWKVSINNVYNVEYSFRNSIVKLNNSNSIIYFDFNNNILTIHGDLTKEIFRHQEGFNIIKHDVYDSEYRFFLSTTYSRDIIMTCTIKRGFLLFEGTLENWYSNIHSKNVQTFLN